jgi:Ca2+-binding RTX toxin-like protein
MGGAGDDIINAGAALTNADRLNGGAGSDTLNLSGDYSSGLPTDPATLVSIENIVFGPAFSYSLVLRDANVAAGQTLQLDGSALGAGDTLTIQNKGESDGHYTIIGGAGADNLAGGKLADTIQGGAGADILAGGGGADLLNGGSDGDAFFYGVAAESTGLGRDTITGFSASEDVFLLPSAVTRIDTPVTHGALNRDSFDGDLSTALNSAALGRNHAVLFTPDSGKLGGHIFLVVDLNGQAGYQAGQDLVVELVDASGHFTRANFTTAI